MRGLLASSSASRMICSLTASTILSVEKWDWLSTTRQRSPAHGHALDSSSAGVHIIDGCDEPGCGLYEVDWNAAQGMVCGCHPGAERGFVPRHDGIKAAEQP